MAARRPGAAGCDIGQVLLKHADVIVWGAWWLSLEGISAAGPENRVDGDPAGHRLATVVGDRRQWLRRGLSRLELTVLESASWIETERIANARVKDGFRRQGARRESQAGGAN